jgi:outer membrane protein assembly factor BamB
MKRTRILVLILCACFVPVVWGQQAHTGSDWKQFHRGNMKRANPYESVLNVDNVGNLELKWSYTTGQAVYTSPAVADGVVYVGSYDGNVYAFSLK